MSTLYNIAEAIVLFVFGFVPAIVSDIRNHRQSLPVDWTSRQEGSAGVGFVMFLAFMVLVGMVLVFAMQSGGLDGSSVQSAATCYTPGGIQIVCQ